MSVFTTDNFPEIKSEPNWTWTYCIRVIIFLLFVMLLMLFYVAPFLFYTDEMVVANAFITFSIIYYPLLIWLSYLGLRYLRRIRGNTVRHIVVNRKGVFYEKLNGTVESLLYSQLEKSSDNFNIYDVFIGSNHVYTGTTMLRQTFLKVFLKGKEKKAPIFHPDTAYSYFARNSWLLRTHFIQGIRIFCPNLRIAPNVYSEFSIHPETFEFDKKEYWKAIVLAIVFIILLFIGIEWYMKYRFGESLLF